MILALSLLSSCWEFILRHPGLLFVLIGVVGEVVCDWKEMTGRLARAKKVSAILLVLGLAIEFIEAAKSDKELAETKEHTAVAVREASQANERAAKFDADRVTIEMQAEQIRSTNFVLQTKLLELETKLQDRKLTSSQSFKLLECLRASPKGYVWVASDTTADPTAMKECREFAQQIAGVMTAAGFEHT